MTNLTRVTGKIFGETASTSNTPKEIGQFGSAKAGTYNATGDVATIQNLSAWSNGWIDAVTPTQQFPSLPEMTGVHKVLSYQNAYLLQKGVAEWDSNTTYYTGDFCKGVGEGKLYVSKVDSNTNHAVTDGNYWEEFSSGNSRNIGEIVTSTIPLTDAGLHLLDGALLTYGSYQAFIDYIADLYDSGNYSAIFDTEANWQASVTLTGVCDKFVYDSVNNTVRLPKYGNQIFTKSPTIASTIPVKGNGNALGLLGKKSSATVECYLDNNSASTYHFYAGSSSTPPVIGTTLSTLSGSALNNDGAVGVNTDGTKSGLIADLSSITNYPLDCYYYIVIATTAKTSIQVDIDEIATDLNGKMDTDGTNAVSSVKFADGQWVKSQVTLASLATAPTSTDIEHDLSTYLPNDNYSYEVLFLGTSTTGSTSGNQSMIALSSQYFDGAYLCRAHTRSSSVITDSGCSILPIGSNHKVTVNANASNSGTYSLLALAYRRIGTNQ